MATHLLVVVVSALLGSAIAGSPTPAWRVVAGLGLWLLQRGFAMGKDGSAMGAWVRASAIPSLVSVPIFSVLLAWKARFAFSLPNSAEAWTEAIGLGIALLLGAMTAALVTGVTFTATRLALVKRADSASQPARDRRQRESALPQPGKFLTVVIKEVPLALWIAVAWAPGSPVDGVAPHVWGAMLASLTLVFAFWEDVPTGNFFAPRAVAGLLAAVIAWRRVVAFAILAWDFAIEDALINAPGNLSALIVRLLFFIAAVVFAAIVSIGGVCAIVLNVAGEPLLRLYFRLDAAGRAHSFLRHAGHRVGRSWFGWIAGLALRLAGWVLGGLPGWLWPRRVIPARFESHVRNMLDETNRWLEPEFVRWRCGRLPGAMPYTLSGVARGARSRAKWLQALHGHLVCPWPFCPTRAATDELWAVACSIDLHLADCAILIHPDKGLPKGKADRIIARRIVETYLLFDNGVRGPIAAFRRACLSVPPDETARASFRDGLLTQMPSDSASRHFVVSALLSEYRKAEDWEGMIETSRRAEVHAGFTLNAHEHLATGEAWYRHAVLEIAADNDPGRQLRHWALAQALFAFYAAGSPDHVQLVAATMKGRFAA